jgi:flagellar motor switch protein FliG
MASAAAASGLKKAAIFLVTIGEQASAELLKRLAEDEVKAVSKAIVRLDSVPREETDAILEAIYQDAFSQSPSARGGLQYARKILSSAFGPEGARRLSEHLARPVARNSKDMEVLQKADPRQLVRFLEEEHPQTVAIILAHLSTQQAASLLESFSAQIRSEIVVRIAELEHVSPDVVARIAVVMSDRIRVLGEMKREIGRGPRSVAEILNRMDSDEAESILNDIQDPQLVDAIRNFMFVFEDVLLIDPKMMKEVVARIDRKILIVALKGTSERIKDHFLGGMSQRAKEMFSEDMEALGPVKIKDVRTAQQQIVATVRQLETEGVLSLKGGAEEEYVV